LELGEVFTATEAAAGVVDVTSDSAIFSGGVDPVVDATAADVASAVDDLEEFSAAATTPGLLAAMEDPVQFAGGVDEVKPIEKTEYCIVSGAEKLTDADPGTVDITDRADREVGKVSLIGSLANNVTDALPVSLSGSNVVLETKATFIKRPTSRLIFDEYIDTRSLGPIAKSYVPGKSYGIDHGWVAVSEDAWETKTNGISFGGQGNGSCTAMVVWPDESICAITSQGKIVTMADINSNHVVTLETVGLVGGFADFYCDGLNRIVVAGEYTQGDSVAKKLYLSMDGGATFEIIKTGDTLDPVNNHWHGVCYDPYSGAIWAAQGDTENAKIYFTYDLGVTWHEVDAQGQRFQPTLIHAFPDKVIFGEDSSSQKPGLFTYKRVGNEQPTTITLDRLLTFRTDKGANVFYPDKKKVGRDHYSGVL